MHFGSLVSIFTSLCLFLQAAEGFNFTFHPDFVPELPEGEKQNITLVFEGTSFDQDACARWFSVVAEPSRIAGAELDCLSATCDSEVGQTCNVTMVLEGKFLGLAKAHFLYRSGNNSQAAKVSPHLNIQVVKIDTALSKSFVGLVATLMTINYITMGCALDMDVVKRVLKRPIGPVIGFTCQFLIMPVVAYGAGLLFFSDDPILRLGIFTFGCSPGGGASNMWTVILRGNLNLSITMTFLSIFAAFGTIPLWLFTLGKKIVHGTRIRIPFESILTSLASMIIALGVGLLIQKYLPRVAAFAKRILSPVCIFMIIILVVLGSIAYSYMLLMLTWTMVFATTLSVWMGFLAGCVVSFIFRLPREDIIAVAVETGIQNTGIAFVLLTYSLKPPFSQISSVVPVAASIVTPIPLLVVMCIQRLRDRLCRSGSETLASLSQEDLNYREHKSINGVENQALETDALRK